MPDSFRLLPWKLRQINGVLTQTKKLKTTGNNHPKAILLTFQRLQEYGNKGFIHTGHWKCLNSCILNSWIWDLQAVYRNHLRSFPAEPKRGPPDNLGCCRNSTMFLQYEHRVKRVQLHISPSWPRGRPFHL